MKIEVKRRKEYLREFLILIVLFFAFNCLTGQSFIFTNAGVSGRLGPTQTDVDSAYSGTSLSSQVTVTGSGIQPWQPPYDGLYLIQVYGAGYNESLFQRGAYMSGEFMLQSSKTLSILVGQKGENARCGSGGSFVAIDSIPLIVAGGAGGQAENAVGDSILSGSVLTSGQGGLGGVSGNGGVGGAGGTWAYCDAHSGAGFSGDGEGCRSPFAKAFLNGGEGSVSFAPSSNGGFGGGGNGNLSNAFDLGGGGGYSGGGSAGSDNNSYGGGGGSFNSGTNQINISGYNAGHGRVVITPLSSNAPNDAGVLFIDSSQLFCPGSKSLTATLKNFGNNQITSLDIEWTINGQPQPTFNFSGLLDTIGGSGNAETQINLGSYSFSDSVYNVVVWTASPNNSQDTVNHNDTARLTLQSAIQAPTGVTVSNISGGEAFFSWTPWNAGNYFIYTVVPQGADPSGATFGITDTITITGLSPLTEYDFYVREVCPGGSVSSDWSSPVTFKMPYYCPTNAYCFTNAGSTGSDGPTQSDLNTEYSSTNLAGNVTSIDGLQRWIVPSSGLYELSIYGAVGGGNNITHRGKGGEAKGTVYFYAGDTVFIAVGQSGEYNNFQWPFTLGGFNGGGNGGQGFFRGSSGGGASDIRVNDTALSSRIIVAGGGGGGAGNGANVTRRHAGGGGGGGYYGGGGGNGANSIPYINGKGGTQISGGAGGGSSTLGNTHGSIGKGGEGGSTTSNAIQTYAINQYGGDGGGLIGGNGSAGEISYMPKGGGGGSSYLSSSAPYSFTNTSTKKGVNEGQGKVIIEPFPTHVCSYPQDLVVLSTSLTSSEIAWSDTNNNMLDWEVAYNFLTGEREEERITSVGSNPITLTELSPGNTYKYNVRSTCSAGDTSAWSAPKIFTTCPFGGFSGTYIIDKSKPNTDSSFNSFTEALRCLKYCGVAGPVKFLVQPGEYREIVSIDSIPGTSQINTVTFKGVNPATTRLIYEQHSFDSMYTVRFMDVSHVILDSLTIAADKYGTFGKVININNNSKYITIKNCSLYTLDNPTTNRFDVISTVYNSSNRSTGVANLTLDNNYIRGGYDGIKLYGNTGAEVVNSIISSNKLEKQFHGGILLENCDSAFIEDNIVQLSDAGSSLYGILCYVTSEFQIASNKIKGANAYGIQMANSSGTASNRAIIKNNSVTSGFNTAIPVPACIMLSQTDFTDIFHNTVNMSMPQGSGFRMNLGSFIRLLNNIFVQSSDTATGYAAQFQNVSNIQSLNYNNYFNAGNNFVFFNGPVSDLSALQNAIGYINNDVTSLQVDPEFLSRDLLWPMNPGLSNGGTNTTQVSEDIIKNLRDTLNPSIGAYELFLSNEDIGLIGAELVGEQCQGSADSIIFTITKTVGSTTYFNSDNLSIAWEVKGPVNSSGVAMVTSDSLAVGDTMTIVATEVDLSLPGKYFVNRAYIDTSSVNNLAINDTLKKLPKVVFKTPFSVSPRIDTVRSVHDTVVLSVKSALLPERDYFISEICHYKINDSITTGTPVTGWPHWLKARAYIEITGNPNSDLDGYTMEQWRTTGLITSHTFSSGTILSPDGTLILAVGGLDSSVTSPGNYYYHATGNPSLNPSFTTFSRIGRVLYDADRNIVDAVGYHNFQFPSIANVPPYEWSSPYNFGNVNFQSGIRLIGEDNNTGDNWVLVDDTNYVQDPNTVNQGVSLPGDRSMHGLSWSFQTVVFDTNETVTVGPFSTPGNYEYVAQYTDSTCGIMYDTSTVVVAFTEVEIVNAINPSCNGASTGEIQVKSSGGQPPFKYAWSDNSGRTGNVAANLPAGTYGITITDVNDVKDSTTITLVDPPQLSISFNVIPSSCGGSDGEASANVTGGVTPYSYDWEGGGTGASKAGLSGGRFYGVTVSDSLGCTLVDSIGISDVGAPSANFNIITDINCAEDTIGEVEVNLTGGVAPFVYDWSNNYTGSRLTNVSGGKYFLTVVDSSGCRLVDSVSLYNPDTLKIINQIKNDLTCNGAGDGSIELVVSGGVTPYSFSWSNSSSTSFISNLAPGTYLGTVTDANGCTVTGDSLFVSEPSPLAASLNTNHIDCNGNANGSLEAVVTGGTTPYNYAWSRGDSSATATGLDTGVYTVTITDSKGCDTIIGATITEPDSLSLTVASQQISCSGVSDGELTAHVTGGVSPYQYLWSNGDTVSLIGGLSSGGYMLLVSDSNGCHIQETETIVSPQPLMISSSVTDVKCRGNFEGEIDINVTGGLPPYNFTWSTGDTTQIVDSLPEGAYSVTIEDANTCDTSLHFYITAPPILTATAIITSEISCNGNNDGSATVFGGGGIIPYSYNWSNGDSIFNAGNLGHGITTVTITDSYGCTAVSSVDLVDPPVLSVSVGVVGMSCFGLNDGSATAVASGGTPGYSYLWSNNAVTSTASGLASGSYTITLTDVRGCDTTASASVIEPDPISVSINAQDVSCHLGSDGEAELTVTGGTTPYRFNWSTGDTINTAQGLKPRDYTVTITDGNNCEVSRVIRINQPPRINSDVIIRFNASLRAVKIGNDITYQWWDCEAEEIVTGANGQYFEPAANGTYALIISEAGCQDTSSCFVLTRVSAADIAGEANTFEVYPNPNRGCFKVYLTGNSESAVQLDVMDMQGKQLLSRNIGRLSGELTEELNINLASGVYFVKVIRDGEMSIKRVVVQ